MALSHDIKMTKATKPEISKQDPEYVKLFLETTSSNLLKAWDRTDFDCDFIRKHCTQDFTMEYYPHIEFPWPRTRTLEDHIAHMDELKRMNPAWRMRAFNFNVVLDHECQHAVVWFTSGPSGRPGDHGEWWITNRESVSKLKWRRRTEDREWECYGHTVMRGGSGFGDFNQTIYAD